MKKHVVKHLYYTNVIKQCLIVWSYSVSLLSFASCGLSLKTPGLPEKKAKISFQLIHHIHVKELWSKTNYVLKINFLQKFTSSSFKSICGTESKKYRLCTNKTYKVMKYKATTK